MVILLDIAAMAFFSDFECNSAVLTGNNREGSIWNVLIVVKCYIHARPLKMAYEKNFNLPFKSLCF